MENEFVLTTYNGLVTKRKRVFAKARKPIRNFFMTYREEKGRKQFLAMQKKYKATILDRFYLQDPFNQVSNLTKMANAEKSMETASKFVKLCKIMRHILEWSLISKFLDVSFV